MAIPYIHLIEGRDPVEVLAATPQHLASLLDPLSSEEIEHKPAPGKWNLREVMTHLADCELVWGWRLRQVYGEDNPTLQPFDQDSWAKAYGSYSYEQARSTWQALRAWNIAFLRSMSAADRARPATHLEHGQLTLWTIASIAAGHDLHHLAALERPRK